MYVLLYVTLCPFSFCNHLGGKERAGCFAWFVFLVSRDCCVALPRGAMGLSAVCDCSISHTRLLFVYIHPLSKEFGNEKKVCTFRLQGIKNIKLCAS